MIDCYRKERYHGYSSQAEAQQSENGEIMTEFDKNYSFFMVSDTVAELKEGAVQIQHRRSGVGHGISKKTAQFNIKTSNIPELINVLEEYYKSVTAGSPEPEECQKCDENPKSDNRTIEERVRENETAIDDLHFVLREHGRKLQDSQCVNKYEIWGKMVGTGAKFYAVIQAPSIKQARIEAEEKMKQWGCGKAFECGANLKT